MFDIIIPVLAALSKLFPTLKDKAEFARIGKYYSSESMLVLNTETGRYDEEITPSYGKDTLQEFYARVLKEGLAGQELGAHAVFKAGATPQTHGNREAYQNQLGMRAQPG